MRIINRLWTACLIFWENIHLRKEGKTRGLLSGEAGGEVIYNCSDVYLFFVCLHLSDSIIIIDEEYFTSLVIKAKPPRLQDGGDGLGDSPSGKFVIKVSRTGGALIDLARCPHEPLETDVAVAGLTAVAALAVGDVADVEGVEGQQAVRLVRGESVAAVTLRGRELEVRAGSVCLCVDSVFT